MKQYLDLLRQVRFCTNKKEDRTGTGTLSIFGHQARYDLQEGFPLSTTKGLHLKSIIHELLWIISGSTNIKYLNDNGVRIWNEWADESGELGPVYGKQWRAWEGPAVFVPTADFATDEIPDDEGEYLPGATIDQLKNVIERIKTHPDDRRLIVTAWNPAEVDKMALPPCHCFFQFYTRELSIYQRTALSGEAQRLRGTVVYGDALRCDHVAVSSLGMQLDDLGVPRRVLDCQLYQRSADIFLGVPFNIASYALLTMMVAQECGMVPGTFVHTLGDAHLYLNHLNQADLQLSREPRDLPKMVLNPNVKSVFDFKYEDFTLTGYDPHPGIYAPVSV